MCFSERGQWGGNKKHLVVVTLCEQINVTITSLVPGTKYVRNKFIENAQRVIYDSFANNVHSMHSVHDGNLALVNLEDNNIADGKMLRLHPQKKNVASAKRRLHTAT